MSPTTADDIPTTDSQVDATSQVETRKPRKLGRKILAVALALVGLFVLIGVMAKPEAAVSAIVPGVVPTSDVYVPPGAAAASDPANAPLLFGAKHTWENGMAVTLGKAQVFKPGQYAAKTSTPAARAVTFEVTITNGTSENYSAMSTIIAATFAGADAERMFDAASKVGGPPMTDILPGKSATFRVAFAIPTKDPGELQVEIGPAYGLGDKAIYVGSV